jgi:two-component system sensor histidine kinase BarA
MALKQAANKADLAQEMLGMLLSTLPEIVTLSNQAIDGELSSEQLLYHIHKLHGSCTYSGVPRLRKICATLEQALRSGQSIEDVEPEIYELQDEVEKVIQEGKRFTQQS